MILPREPRKYLEILPEIGLSPSRLLSDHGFDWPAVEALEPMTGHEIVTLLEILATNTPRRFGIYCGSVLPTDRLGVFGNAMMNCSTLREMFALWNRCSVVAGHPLAGSLSTKGSVWVCEMRARMPLGPHGLRFVAEASAVGFVRLCRELLGREDVLAAVAFPFPQPADFDDFYTALGLGKVQFDALHLSLSGTLDDLDLPVVRAETEVRKQCERQCHAEMANLRSAVPLRTRLEMLALSSERLPGAGAAAAQLGMSRRTLFRHLAAEDTSFHAIIDDVRRQLAFRMLRTSHISLKEIAWRLGFDDTRSFRRSFSSWTGMPISAWIARGSAA